MLVAFALVYMSLVVQYRSFKKSVFVMVTVPLSLIGILTGFLFLDHFFGIYLTATALIGFIALIGIVGNNAIIFSGYLNHRLAEGVPFQEALVEAGGARFRPIMLTSLTNVLGTLTIVGDPVWSGLAWAIIFGLSLSASLTLVVYPTLLAYFSDETRV
jgi:multidrug efflux pump subunit AcrB